MITLKEIARLCNVTTSTVSNVLNGKPNVGEETRRKVLEMVEQMEYQPNYFAQGMRKIKTRMIGIITEDLYEFSTTPIVETVMAYCDENNYRTILSNMRLYDKWGDTWYSDDEKHQSVFKPALQQHLSIRVDGIIYIAGHCRPICCFPEDFKVPTIIVYGLSQNPRFPSVILDDEQGAYDMAQCLIKAGHKKIGIITGKEDNIHSQKRLIGIQKALFEAGIPYNPEWVVVGDWKRQSGYTGAQKLMSSGITGLLCMNDNMAAGAYDYMYGHKLVIGRDVSIVGYDNKEISTYLYPELTTYDINLKETGTKAAEMLVHRLENPDSVWEDGQVVKITGQLIGRDSVKKIGE